jgi:outer membrane protein assembly complex protein YaeT
LDDVFVVFSTDLSNNENQLYEVDWRLSRRFRLAARRDTTGGIGGDVRYTDRFWWNKPPPVEPPPSPAGPRPVSGVPDDGRVVGTVRIEGVETSDASSLRQLLELHTGEPFSRSDMFRGVEAIKRHYVRAGRIETRVDASIRQTDTAIDVTYVVSPSPPVSVEFRGTTRKEERRLRPILETLWIESVFGEELYDDAVDRIREFYHGRGHYAADVRSRREQVDGGRQVIFEVESGEPVRVLGVTIRGAESIPQARIRAQMLTRPTTLLQRQPLMAQVLEDDVAAIRNLFRDEGFLQVRVAEPRILLSSSADAAEVELEIEEGPQYRISEVRFPQDLPFSVDQMQAWAGAEPGQVFSPSALLRAESRLRAGVDRLGYPEARVQSRVELDQAQARVRFEIEPGGRRRVGEISIRGNRLTQEKVIRRELELSEGELISRADILRTQHRLYQLGIFRSVNLSYSPLDPDDPTDQLLEIRLEEAAPLSTSIGLGYDTESKARVSFSLTHDNVSGYDRVVSVQGKASSLERRLVVVGKEPRLFNRGGLVGLASVGWEKNKLPDYSDESWTVAFRAAKRLNARWGSFARYAFQFVELTDVTISLEELQAEHLVDGRLGDLGVGLIRDTRDNPFLPRTGTYLELGARLFSRPFGSEFTFTKFQASASSVHTLRRGSAIAGGVRVGLAFPYGSNGAVPISQAFFAGGDSTIRGFSRDAVGPVSGGESLLILNGEFRFPLWRDLKGVAFYDTGNVYLEIGDFDATDLRHVLGLGLRLETSIGPLRLEYGRKVDREPDESSGELFLSIGSAF